MSAAHGVIDRLGHLRDDIAGQVRIQPGDKRGRDQRSRNHLIGRDWGLDIMRVVDVAIPLLRCERDLLSLKVLIRRAGKTRRTRTLGGKRQQFRAEAVREAARCRN